MSDTTAPPAETRALTLRWPAALREHVREIAARQDRSITAKVRMAVREHVQRAHACAGGRLPVPPLEGRPHEQRHAHRA